MSKVYTINSSAKTLELENVDLWQTLNSFGRDRTFKDAQLSVT